MFNLDHEKLILAFPHETIKIGGVPYLTRYYISGKNDRRIGEGRSIFLHCFHTSDQGRELHNHPYAGHSYILKGGYFEERSYGLGEMHADGTYESYTPVTRTWYGVGAENVIELNAFHRTDLPKNDDGSFQECWTLFVTSERVKSWGFLDVTSEKFYPYMDPQDARLGRGPQAREDIDTSIAERRATETEDVELPYGVSQVTEGAIYRVSPSIGHSFAGKLVKSSETRACVGSTRVYVGTEDGDMSYVRADSLRPSKAVFNYVGPTDSYGCPDRSWLISAPAAVEAPVARAFVPEFKEGDLVEFKDDDGWVDAVIDEVDHDDETMTYSVTTDDHPYGIWADNAEVRARRMRAAPPAPEPKRDAYGCPDMSWLRPQDVKVSLGSTPIVGSFSVDESPSDPFAVGQTVRFARPEWYQQSYKGRQGQVRRVMPNGDVIVELNIGRTVRATPDRFANV